MEFNRPSTEPQAKKHRWNQNRDNGDIWQKVTVDSAGVQTVKTEKEVDEEEKAQIAKKANIEKVDSVQNIL